MKRFTGFVAILAALVILLPTLALAEFEWSDPGGNPFGKNRKWMKAIDKMALPAVIKADFKILVEREWFDGWRKNKFFNIEKGMYFNQMVFGNYVIKNDVKAAWKDQNHLLAARRYTTHYKGLTFHLYCPLVCSNWAWRLEEAPPKPPQQVLPPSGFNPPPLPPPPTNPITLPPPPQPPANNCTADWPDISDDFDAIMGAGNYVNDHAPDGSGEYAWGKVRYRPLEVAKNVKVGGFAFGAAGQGHDGKYNYNWQEFTAGPSATYKGNSWDVDVDVGYGKLWNNGEEGSYRSKQEDHILRLSAHWNWYWRRDAGLLLFPKGEANFEYRLPISSNHEHSWNGNRLPSDPHDNHVVELAYRQDVYDFYSPNGDLRFTPGWNFIGGHEADPNGFSFKTGPTLTIGSQGEDIIGLSVGNYRWSEVGGQLHPIGAYINVGGALRAYRAYQITDGATQTTVNQPVVKSPGEDR